MADHGYLDGTCSLSKLSIDLRLSGLLEIDSHVIPIQDSRARATEKVNPHDAR